MRSGEWVTVVQLIAAGRQAEEDTDGKDCGWQGQSTEKKACVAGAQRDGTKISGKEVVGIIQGTTVYDPG